MQQMETAINGPTAGKICDAEQAVRAGFVRKVYGILCCQLALTVAIAAPIATSDPYWVRTHMHYAKMCSLMSLVLIIGVGCCCQEVARKYPQNYIFLLLVTVCEAVIVGFISAMYTTQSVLLAAFLTSAIFAGLTFYACTTENDFTGMGGYLYAAVWGLFLTSLLCMFFPYSPMMDKMFAGAGAIIFSMYIVYDTQLIIGGRHKQCEFGVDDYVFAALNIYLDIIQLFIYLLELMGDRRN